MTDGVAMLLHPTADEVKLCNPTGTYIWALVCKRQHTPAELAAAVAAEFEVDEATAADDVDDFLAELARDGFITWR